MKMPDLRPYKDETDNDSDKSWVVPDGEVWNIVDLAINYASSATVGNRFICAQAKDKDGDVCWRVAVHAAHPASLTARYQFAPGLAVLTWDAALYQEPFPNRALLLPGWTLQVFDAAAIDAAADDMHVYFQVEVGTV